MGQRDSELYQQFFSLENDIRLKMKKYVIGFLKSERITWQKSSAELLEKVCIVTIWYRHDNGLYPIKICSYEAVHAVKDWKDIKRYNVFLVIAIHHTHASLL